MLLESKSSEGKRQLEVKAKTSRETFNAKWKDDELAGLMAARTAKPLEGSANASRKLPKQLSDV
jgi:hypothetical protein